MNGHLSSAQLDGVLSGQASAETSAHVNSCTQCTAEIDALRMVFGDMRLATVAAAEHHRRLASPTAARRVPRMAWALAVSALFVSIAVPVAVRSRPARPVNGTVSGPVMMSDEALLDSVNNDLSSSVPESLQPLASTSLNVTTNSNTTRKN